MVKFTEQQINLIESDAKLLLCNWDRATGKTISIIEKILRRKGSWLFVDNNSIRTYSLVLSILTHDNYFNGKVRLLINKGNGASKYMELEDIHGNIIKLYFMTYNKLENLKPKCDYVVIEDIFIWQFNPEKLKCIEQETQCKQIIVTMSDDSVEIIGCKSKGGRKAWKQL